MLFKGFSILYSSILNYIKNFNLTINPKFSLMNKDLAIMVIFAIKPFYNFVVMTNLQALHLAENLLDSTCVDSNNH